MNRTYWPLLSATALALTSANVTAGAEEPIEEVVVTATPLNRAVDDLTQAWHVVDEEALLLKSANSIGETLANELGMSTTYFGPVAGRPVIRGQDGPRVAVLDGGLSTLDAADISPDHAVPLEPLFAKRIEVLRGPATLLYGSSAAGGVVNVIDGRIPEVLPSAPLSGALELRADTAAQERTAAARLDGGVDSFAWHLDGFKRDSEDIDIPGFATAEPADRPDEEVRGRVLNSRGKADGYAGGLSWIGDRGFAGASISRYETTYGLPGPEEEEAGDEADMEDALVAPGPFIDLEQTRLELHGEWSFDVAIERIRFKLAHNDYQHQEIEPTGEVATTFKNDAWEGRFEFVHAPVNGWRGSLGLQFTERDFSAVGAEAFVPVTDSRALGVFLLEAYSFDSALIEIGARVERLEHSPSGGLPDYDEVAYSTAIGFNWGIFQTYDFRANLSYSQRNLALEELYSDGPHLATGLFEIGLLALEDGSVDQEAATNLDVAIHHHGENLDWHVGVFYNDIANYVYRVATEAQEDGLAVTPYLQAGAKLYGFEAEALFALGGPETGWNLRVFTDYVRGKTGSDDLPRIQPLRLGTQLSYESVRWSAGLDAIHHAAQNDVDSFHTNSFTMVDANLTLHLNDAGPMVWDIFLRGRNLLDEDARRSTSFRAAYVPLPGASVQLGVRARFN